MRGAKNKQFRLVFIAIMIMMLSLPFTAQPICSAEKIKVEKKQTEDSTNPQTYEPPAPAETTTNSTSPSLLVGGAVAVGVGVAMALGGGGGGSDGVDSTASAAAEPAPTLSPVGPSIAGKWGGVLRLVNHGTESVSATITQNGKDITITTNSTLPYGQNFVGHINTRGYVTVRDRKTHKIWTSYQGVANSHYLKIYDLVNNNEALDRLELRR